MTTPEDWPAGRSPSPRTSSRSATSTRSGCARTSWRGCPARSGLSLRGGEARPKRLPPGGPLRPGASSSVRASSSGPSHELRRAPEVDAWPQRSRRPTPASRLVGHDGTHVEHALVVQAPARGGCRAHGESGWPHRPPDPRHGAVRATAGGGPWRNRAPSRVFRSIRRGRRGSPRGRRGGRSGRRPGPSGPQTQRPAAARPPAAG